MLIPSDKLREECGVVAIYGHPEASKLAYLSLYALQHRGQESAGIAASNGEQLQLHKAMGLVSDIFTADVLARIPGSLAIGHTRYSTTGDSALLNAQPIMVECNKGKLALAHNGNITNAHEIRAATGAAGLHLPDHQRYRSRGAPDCPFARTDAARRHGRFAAPHRRRIFAGDADPRPHLCRPRSARLSSAGHGPHSRQRRRTEPTPSFSPPKPVPST